MSDAKSIMQSLVDALKEMVAVNDGPCCIDHHGYCQEHYLDDVNNGGCRVANAKTAMSAAEELLQHQSKAVKPDTLVNGGALQLALNSLRRGTQSQQEIAEELALTVARQPQETPDQQLCHFYQAETFPELVAAMEKHIERLQSKLPPLRDTQPGRVREG